MPNHPSPIITLAHGGGGQLTDQLLAESILPKLANPLLNDLLDAAHIGLDGQTLALTIDSYVVQPLEFPGGDIGRLAVSGTINDLAVSGARPVGIALSLILTEGLDRAVLERLIDSIARTAAEAGVRIVTGDTKVVGRGQGDGLYVTTAGVGVVPAAQKLHPRRVQPGDVILLNGPIADHGLAVMLAREMPEVQSVLRSDVAPLNKLTQKILAAGGQDVVFMRDPTRGGLAGMASDLAQRTGLNIVLEERHIPVRPETRHAADMLGLDPLDVANEGKIVAVVRPQVAQGVLAAMRHDPLGAQAATIGWVAAPPENSGGRCELMTTIGGRRIVQKPYGEQLPRIC